MITGLDDDFPAAIATLPLPLTDGRRVMACVHQPTPGTAERAYAAVYTVDNSNHATRLGRSEGGKATAVALLMVDTVVQMWVTQPIEVSGGGAQNVIKPYSYPVGARMVAIDQPARDQARAAQHVANAAWAGVGKLDARVTALED